MASHSSAAPLSDDQAELFRPSSAAASPNPKLVLADSKKQNAAHASANPNPADPAAPLFKAHKTPQRQAPHPSSLIASHGSSVSTTDAGGGGGGDDVASAATRTTTNGFPAGRYNSPTDSLISPISRGLLRRGKTKAPHYNQYLRSNHEPLDVSSVPPKVLDNSYDI